RAPAGRAESSPPRKRTAALAGTAAAPTQSEAKAMEISRIMVTLEYGTNREADDAVRRWLEERRDRLGLYIGGQWRRPQDAETFPSVNPATGETLAHIVQARPRDVDDAVAAARAAAPEWRSEEHTSELQSRGNLV